jgi:hypothetical protein
MELWLLFLRILPLCILLGCQKLVIFNSILNYLLLLLLKLLLVIIRIRSFRKYRILGILAFKVEDRDIGGGGFVGKKGWLVGCGSCLVIFSFL